jgi:5-methylcytosine-specific restriction endonuclease McrA
MIEVECANCGQKLLRHPYRLKYAKNQFCDRRCKGQYMSKHNVGEAHPNFANGGDFHDVACSQCGKIIKRHRDKIKRNEHNFCCRKCYDEWRKVNLIGAKNPNFQTPALKTKCATCKKVIWRKPWRIGTIDRVRHFCSLECKYEWHRTVPVGENSPQWRGGAERYYGPNWRKQRRRARKRDGYRCRVCGKTQKQNGKSLDVHHIIPFKDFNYIPEENDNYMQANDLSNLVSLCRFCHKAVEAGNLPLQLNLL